MNRTCEKCIHYEICRCPLEYRAYPDTCWKYEEPRPHGEWIEKHCGCVVYYRCSNCGWLKNLGLMPYCENCGADMSANDRQVTGKLNSEIEKLKSEIIPDYRDGWKLKEGEKND